MRRVAATLCSALVSLEACAEVSGNLAMVSDYRYRGLSLSDGQPAVQASLAYDHPNGWYAGLFGATVRLPDRPGGSMQVLAYLGYSHPVRPGLHGDAGATYTAFTAEGEYAYPVLYLGLATEEFSARVHYAFDYFGQPEDALYVELNLARPLKPRLQVLGHLGVLRLSQSTGQGSGRVQLDYRIGLGIDLQEVTIQLTWEGGNPPDGVYPVADRRIGTGLVLGLSRSF